MGKNLNKAIILAAGQGSRLRNILQQDPKPLLKINKSTIIEILIKKLKNLKIKKIVIVTGYKSNKIKSKVGRGIKYIYYPNYRKTNNLHTLLHVRKELDEPLLCLFSDVIFDMTILKKLINSKKNIVMAVDRKSKLPGTMKVVIKNNLIREIGNHIEMNRSNGNFIGFSKFSNYGCKIIKKSLKNYENSNFGDYYTLALNSLIKQKSKINFVNVSNYYWKEIDNKKDYFKAKKMYKKILLKEKNKIGGHG